MLGLWFVIAYLTLGVIAVRLNMLNIAVENEYRDRGQLALFVLTKVVTWPWWVFKK